MIGCPPPRAPLALPRAFREPARPTGRVSPPASTATSSSLFSVARPKRRLPRRLPGARQSPPPDRSPHPTASTPRTRADLAFFPLDALFSRQDQTTEVARRKKRSVKTNNRSLVGASLEVIQKKRSEKTEVRAAARDAALREIKERQRKAKDSKKGKK